MPDLRGTGWPQCRKQQLPKRFCCSAPWGGRRRPRGGEGCGQRERVSRASDITEQARQLHILLDIQHSHWLPIPQRKSGTSALEKMAKHECRSKPQAIQQQLQITATGNDLSVRSQYVYSVLWYVHTLEQQRAVHNEGARNDTQCGQI